MGTSRLRTGTTIPVTMHMTMTMTMTMSMLVIAGMGTPMGVTHTPWLPSR